MSLILLKSCLLKIIKILTVNHNQSKVLCNLNLINKQYFQTLKLHLRLALDLSLIISKYKINITCKEIFSVKLI